MLHTINKSPYEKNSLDACLRVAAAGSAILLIEDAVYAAVNNGAWAARLGEAMGDVKVYILQPDAEARGIQDRVMEGVTPVDYNGFVDLAAEHDKVQSWL